MEKKAQAETELKPGNKAPHAKLALAFMNSVNVEGETANEDPICSGKGSERWERPVTSSYLTQSCCPSTKVPGLQPMIDTWSHVSERC